MKKVTLLMLLLQLLIGVSCKKDNTQKECYQVRYVMNYCPNMGVLVEFTEPNPDATKIERDNGKVIYQAALLNIPEQYHIKDKVFYVKYHYDKDKENELNKGMCPAIFSPVKILIGDYASENDCKNP